MKKLIIYLRKCLLKVALWIKRTSRRGRREQHYITDDVLFV